MNSSWPTWIAIPEVDLGWIDVDEGGDTVLVCGVYAGRMF